jgi:tetratricopeptide (TPR) repeat protein
MLRRLVDDHAGLPPRVAIERLVLAAGLSGEIPLILPALRHWSQAAPTDHELHDLLHKWSPKNTMLSLDGRKPLRSWRDATIDNRKLPWPGLELSQRFAIRWRGALRIDQAGSYVLATESDDGSRLAVGEVVVDNSGGHAMRVRHMRADLEAGWLPLHLEFAQGGGEAGCRLLWQPPGAPALVPIPAANLAERENGPAGLAADGFDQTRQPGGIGGPDDDELAYARSLPWHLRVLNKTGNDLWEHSRYGDALTFFKAILALDPEHHAGRRAAQCLLWSDPPDADAAIPLMRKHPDLWANGWELTWTTSRLRKLGRLQEVVDAIGEFNRNDSLWPYVRGYAALDRGDLRTARDEFVKVMGEGGPGDRFMPNPELNLARLEWAVLNRLDGKDTDWAEVERGIQRNGGLKPWQELVLDWLSSAASWEDCVARVPMVEDGEDLYYFQGLVAMTTGDHAMAKKCFQEVVTKHPNWMETPTCKALLKWYETQTPESLAKVATAKPIGKPTTQPAKPRGDANDF